MAKYSIKDLEKLSGIKAHTIRIWEKRYKLLQPNRTTTNIRTYSDEELRLLLNISFLNKNGVKISHICELNKSELERRVAAFTEQAFEPSNQIDQLIVAMIDLDETKFQAILSNSSAQIGFETAFIKILFPFLKRIGIMWQTGTINPAQEHFISNLIRQKIIAAIDEQKIKTKQAKKFLLFLPEGELHEIALLFYSYLIRSFQFRSIYIGQSAPLADIVSIAKTTHPDYLVSVITTSLTDKFLNEYLKQLSSKFPKIPIFLSGTQVLDRSLKLSSNITLFKDANVFKELLKQLK